MSTTEWNREREMAGFCHRCHSEPADAPYKTCLKCRAWQLQYTALHRETIYKKNLARYYLLKTEVLMHYSKGRMRCACDKCPETLKDFLTIDHINGGGEQHKREIGTWNIFRWCKENNFPEGFQVLCMNCNWAKRYSGICPHVA
jgi:hypothetical protein